jgi:hypothetical protein
VAILTVQKQLVLAPQLADIRALLSGVSEEPEQMLRNRN